MSKIKVAELFYSLQGEGMYCGVPSVFLRTFGCNFSCQGFGMPRGEISTERLAIDPSQYERYEDLPLVHTGCDSYASWDVRFKHLSPVLTVEAIADRVQQLLPDGKFSRDKHLIITGGEPMLGWQRAYPALFEQFNLRQMQLSEVTFETNGTQKLQDSLRDYLNAWGRGPTIRTTWSVSAKLPVSGEAWEDAIRPDIVREYMSIDNSQTYLKFVAASEEDIPDIERAVAAYRAERVNCPVYIMPVGGTVEVYGKFERQVADICMKQGYRFSPRLQVPLFKNAWGT